jgi:hypothetical protein
VLNVWRIGNAYAGSGELGCASHDAMSFVPRNWTGYVAVSASATAAAMQVVRGNRIGGLTAGISSVRKMSSMRRIGMGVLKKRIAPPLLENIHLEKAEHDVDVSKDDEHGELRQL